MGWRVSYVHAISDQTLRKLLGFDGTDWEPGEGEEADLLCWVGPNDADPPPGGVPQELFEILVKAEFKGKLA